MFLKRVEIQGFKSFADKTVIQFEHPIIGIVGPNGCGKSNINDAIRWVLGEQSAKSLRSGHMSDVIFSGSQFRNAVNVAEVTLVFDNRKRNFNIQFDEVEIKRKLHRTTNEGEYFINKTPCRLKDISNLVMDSGLGRDSLSVISQGNISSFADSKPEDRRALFEEAAGVAKYKKRKNESLHKLQRTKLNLDRVEDIIHELEPRVEPLKRQAKKAMSYMEKKKQLESVEVSVIVDEIQNIQKEMEEIKNELFELGTQRTIAQASLQVEENKNVEAKQQRALLDREVDALQKKYVESVNQISALEARKVELDEKRKYALEHASAQDKLKELSSLLADAKFEFEDREKRNQSMRSELSLLKDREAELEDLVNKCEEAHTKKKSYYHQLQNREEVLKNLIKTPFNHQQGVKSIVAAQSNLQGIKGVVSKLLHPVDDYEIAISNALGAALYHVVCEHSDDARNAIQYLKKNQSGRATFLPLQVLKTRSIDMQRLVICENSEGYLGCASDFVTCDASFETLRDSLLGNVIICDNLKNANYLASLIHYAYKIITLDGDVVHKGGSISGGKIKDQYSPLTLERELKKIVKSLQEQLHDLQSLEQKLFNERNEFKKISQLRMNMQLSMAQLQPVLEAKAAKFHKLQDEYNELSKQHDVVVEEMQQDDLVVQLSKLYTKRDDYEINLSSKREVRMKLANQIEHSDAYMSSTRRDLNVVLELEKVKEISIGKKETNLDNLLTRLSGDYEMTFEHACTYKEEIDFVQAKALVQQLRSEIARLGNVNLDAPQEYEQVKERYETLVQNREELMDAQNKILKAIDEMDDVMQRQFIEMFDKINEQLDETFKSLFGGGKARLYLSNPDDILNSGIEINAQPPGKAVKSMQLLSGGEKSMLAMCVLFAILQVRSVPLCMFDEVEAALDQANVERFAKYISRFKGESQFLIVTHRPGTMSRCDALYGVTMQKNGVSKFLKVNLQEAMSYVDEEEQ